MSKKNKQGRGASPAALVPVETISRRGWKVICAGVAFVVCGFAVLTRADPFGRNWAAGLCPFMILGGYALMGLGIFVPENGQESGKASPSAAPVFSQKNR